MVQRDPAPATGAIHPNRRRFLHGAGAGILGLVAAPLFAACDIALPHVVEIDDQRGFSPGNLTISRGQRVVWKNTGVVPHTVTTDPGTAQNKGNAVVPHGATPWDSGPIYAGQTWSYTFDTPGQYVYFSSLPAPAEGQNRVGSIMVTG